MRGIDAGVEDGDDRASPRASTVAEGLVPADLRQGPLVGIARVVRGRLDGAAAVELDGVDGRVGAEGVDRRVGRIDGVHAQDGDRVGRGRARRQDGRCLVARGGAGLEADDVGARRRGGGAGFRRGLGARLDRRLGARLGGRLGVGSGEAPRSASPPASPRASARASLRASAPRSARPRASAMSSDRRSALRPARRSARQGSRPAGIPAGPRAVGGVTGGRIGAPESSRFPAPARTAISGAATTSPDVDRAVESRRGDDRTGIERR